MSDDRFSVKTLFAPHTTWTLAIVRVGLCFFLLATRLGGDIQNGLRSGRFSPVLRTDSWFLDLVPIPYPLPTEWHAPFTTLVFVTCFTSMIGLLTRPSLLVFAITYTWAGAARASYGFYPHCPALVSQVLLVLAVVPGCSAFSVDRALAWAWRKRNGATQSLFAALSAPVPRWGTWLLFVVVASVYCGSGISKVRWSGVDWVVGETLQYSFKGSTNKGGQRFTGPVTPDPEKAWRDGYGLEHWIYGSPSTPVGKKLATIPGAATFLSFFALAFELGAFVVLINRHWRHLWLACGFAFHVGIDVILHIPFTAWLVLLAGMADWPWIVRTLRAPAAR